MSHAGTPEGSGAVIAERSRRALWVTRCECQHCHAHTFLVLRTIGSAKCKVCESYDLVPVDD